MLPLVDIHVHLLAGLDDGPRTPDDALAMCRRLCAEGAGMAAALAHQNERYPDVTPDVIRAAAGRLTAALREQRVPLTVYPCAEVMVDPDLEASWGAGRLLSIADRGAYLLVEMPHGLYVDLRPTARNLRPRGVRLILAHPERQPEVLHESGAVEALIREGCLVQVSSGSITDPATASDRRALKSWLRRGCVHFLGSDGHSLNRRPPLLAAAYRTIRGWAGASVADRVGSTNGTAVLNGLPLRVPEPEPERRWWPLW